MEDQLVVLMDPWHERHERLMEAHQKLQKLNQNLEEKLLKLAENHHAESQRFSYQTQELTQRLVEARHYIHQLEDENDRYRSDISVVVGLLHCKPSNFVSPKLDTLPDDLQRKVISVRSGSNCKKEKKIIKVQVPTFPPTDIMYSVDKRGKKNSEKDFVSAAIMAKILEERENERQENRKNRCKCASKVVLPLVDAEAQTNPSCTVDYSTFFNLSDFEDDDDEDISEDEDEDIIYERKLPQEDLHSPLENCRKSPTSSSIIDPNSGGNGQLVTVDDIMKTDQKEEELLPTPLFLRRNKDLTKHESQDSTYSTGSSNCNTTTNSSNSNISHSSRISSSNGVFEEDIIYSGRTHPSPTMTSCTSNSHSVSSASPDIQVGLYQHFFDDFDPDQVLQGLNNISIQNHPQHFHPSHSHQLHSTPTLPQPPRERRRGTGTAGSSNTNTFAHSNITSASTTNARSESGESRQKVSGCPQSMSMNFGGRGGNSGFDSGWESHWRTTVLVHHPPKSHSYEPLSLVSSGHHGHGGQITTTFSTNLDEDDSEILHSHREDSPTHENYDDDEENPLLHPSPSRNQSNQYLKALKRTFWKSNNKETEI